MDGDCCLLCLESKQEFADAIFINSVQWVTLSIEHVIDKYFWPMKHCNASSWLCGNCWTELYEFHKFYTRIQKVHDDFGLLKADFADLKRITSTIEIAESELDIKETPKEEKLDYTPDESQIDIKEIPTDDILDTPADKKNCKDDHNSLLQIKIRERVANNATLRKKSKPGRPRKNISSKANIARDALKKTKPRKCRAKEVPQFSTTQTENKETNEVDNVNIKQESTGDFENSSTQQELILLTESSEWRLSPENVTDFKNESDGESLDSFKLKSSTKTNSQTKFKPNEKDKFLAQNFKIKCILCDIPLESFYNMQKHFKVHHAERGYVECCDKKFFRRSILIDHVNYHLNPNFFKCAKCGKAMEDRRRLELHFESHEINNGKNHSCSTCGKTFSRLGYLNRHEMTHLPEEERRFPCSDCDKKFGSNVLLTNHYRITHLKKYVKICDICGKSIRDKTVFERHMLQHEGKAAPSASCDVCGLLLTDEKALKRHKDIIHPVGGQKTYTCSICSKTSPNLRSHKLHVQFTHESGYNYKCTICDKAFKRAPTLKEHMASHTGAILYTCPWCPKTFNSNANMHNHRKKVHPKEWEEASRKRYSGKLPPRFKPPSTIEHTDLTDIK